MNSLWVVSLSAFEIVDTMAGQEIAEYANPSLYTAYGLYTRSWLVLLQIISHA